MATNKPGVLGYFAEYQKAGGQFRLSTNHFETRHDAVSFAFIDVRAVPVIRLSDYEALQAEFVIRLDELSARNYELRMGLAEKTSECEQLRKDAERLAFLASEPVVEGFVGVEKDIYEYACDAAEESGRDEPSEADMLAGLRRMIDAALAEHRKQGGGE